MPLREVEIPVTAPVGTLVLEAVRDTWNLPRLVLSPGRHTLGSDTTCDHVLPVPGVGGQHVLIVIGPQRAVVKALAPLTWINDGPVQEASLLVGDRLIVGPLEFRVRRAQEADMATWPQSNQGGAHNSVDDRAATPVTSKLNRLTNTPSAFNQPHLPTPRLPETLFRQTTTIDTERELATRQAWLETQAQKSAELDSARAAADLAIAEAARREAQVRELSRELQVEVERTMAVREEQAAAEKRIATELQERKLQIDSSWKTAEELLAERERAVTHRESVLQQQELRIGELRPEYERFQNFSATLEAELQRTRTDLDQRAQSLARQEQQLLAARAEFETTLGAWTENKLLTDQELAETREHLALKERELEQRLGELNAETTRVHELSVGHVAQVATQTGTLEQRSREIDNQQSALQSRAHELAEREQQLDAGRARLAELAQASEDQLSRNVLLTQELQENEAAFEARWMKLAEAQREVSAAQSELQTGRESLANHELKLNQLAAELAQQQADVSQRDAELGSRMEYLTGREAIWGDWEQRVTTQAQAFAQEREQLSTSSGELRQREESLRTQVDALQTQTSQVQQQQHALAQHEALLTEQELRLSEREAVLTRELATVNADRESYALRLQEHDQALVTVSADQQALAATRAELSALTERLEQRQAELAAQESTVQRKLDDVNRIADDLNARSAQLAMRLSAVDQAHSALEKTAEDLRRRELALEQQAAASAEFTNRSAAHDLLLEETRQQLQAAQLESDRLRSQIAASERQEALSVEALRVFEGDVLSLREQHSQQVRERGYAESTLRLFETELLSQQQERERERAAAELEVIAHRESVAGDRLATRSLRERLIEMESSAQERLAATQRQLVEQERLLQERSETLLAQAEQLARTESELSRRDQELAQLAQDLTHRRTESDSEVQARFAKLAESESQVDERDQEFSVKAEALAMREESWHAADLQQRTTNQRLQEESDRLQQLVESLRERQSQIAEQEQELAERQNSLTAIGNQFSVLQGEAAAGVPDTTQMRREAELEQRENVLAEQERANAECRQEFKLLTDSLQDREQALKDREHSLARIEAGLIAREQTLVDQPQATTGAQDWADSTPGFDVTELVKERDALLELRQQLEQAHERLASDQRLLNRDRTQIDESLSEIQEIKSALSADHEAVLVERQNLIMDRQEFSLKLSELENIETRILEARDELHRERDLLQAAIIEKPESVKEFGQQSELPPQSTSQTSVDSAEALDWGAADSDQFGGSDQSDEEQPAVDEAIVEQVDTDASQERAAILERYGLLNAKSEAPSQRADEHLRANAGDGGQQDPSAQLTLDVEQQFDANADTSATAEATHEPDVMKLRSHLSQLFGFDMPTATASSRDLDSGAASEDLAAGTTDSDEPAIAATHTESDATFRNRRDTQHSAPTPPVVAAAVATVPHTAHSVAASTAAAVEPEEDSVAAYMERLLARTRRSHEDRTDSAPAPTPTVVTTPTPATDSATAEPRPADTSHDDFTSSSALRPNRKVTTAEDREVLRASMDTMRQVSNHSSRAALAKHAAAKLEEALKVKLVLIAVSALVAILLILVSLFSRTTYWLPCGLATTLSLILVMDLLRSRIQLGKIRKLISDESINGRNDA